MALIDSRERPATGFRRGPPLLLDPTFKITMTKSKKKPALAPTEAEFNRDRRGQAECTHEDILARWKRIRDGAQIWIEECVVQGKSGGTGAATEIYKQSVLEIERIESRTGEGADSTMVWANFGKPDETPKVEA